MLQNIYNSSKLVLGCGNILFGDDGFGPAVIDHLLKNFSPPPGVLIMNVGTSIRDVLFDLVLSEHRPEKLIIVDAVDHPDRNPGEVFEISVNDIPPNKTADFSLHQFPTVNMLKELKDQTAIDVKILVVQIETIPDEVRPGLSRPVGKAVAAASDLIIKDVESAIAAGIPISASKSQPI